MKLVKTTKILIYSDFGCATGFANVTQEIIERIGKKHPNSEFYIYALNNFLPEAYNLTPNIWIFPAHLYSVDKEDLYHRLPLLKMMMDVDFDLFYMIQDVELAATMLPFLKRTRKERRLQNKPLMKMLFYFPIDSVPKKEDLACLSHFDEIVTYTEYGKAAIAPLIGPGVHKRLRVIPHGSDTSMFCKLPAEDVAQFRSEMYPDIDFVIGTINRNSVRKDVSTALMAFAKLKLKPGVEKVAMYLHMNPNDSTGVDLLSLCARLGLTVGKDVIFPEKFNENFGIDYLKLNMLYNSFDLFLTTSTAEGWGLTVTEAMAAGTLVMAPMHTSLKEITRDGVAAIPLRDLDEVVYPGDMEKVRFKVNTEALANRLETTYNMWKHKNEEFKDVKSDYIEAATECVNRLPWDMVAGKFELIFNRLLKL